MSVEELKKLAQEISKEDGERVRAPFPRLFINYDPEVATPGQFAFGGEKDGNGNWTTPPTVIGKSVHIVFLKEYGQYTFFDPSSERVTIRSNIFPKWQAREAYDVITGEPISKLKEVYDIRYTQVTLILILVASNEWKPAIWYMRGATLKAYLDILRQNKFRAEDFLATKIFTLTTKQEKKGSVRYYVPVVEEIREPTEKEAKGLLQVIPEAVQTFKQYVRQYNAARRGEPQQNEGEEELPFDDDDINF